MGPRVFDAWTRTPVLNYPLRSASLIGLMHPDLLIEMRSMVIKRPLISEDNMIDWGHAFLEKDRKQRRLFEEAVRSPKKKSKADQKEANNQSKAVQWAKRGTRAEKIQEIRKELAKALEKLEAFDDTSSSRPMTTRPESRPVLLQSHLTPVRVGTSCSTKLNYILNEVGCDL
jgi:hypothetical protein